MQCDNMKFRMLFFLVYVIVCVHGSADVSLATDRTSYAMPRIDFYPQELNAVVENEMKHVSFGISWQNEHEEKFNSLEDYPPHFRVSVLSENPEILEVVNISYPFCIRARDEPKNFSFAVKGIFLGYTKVRVSLSPAVKGCTDMMTGADRISFPGSHGAVPGFFGTAKEFELSVKVVRPPSVLVIVVTGVMAAFVTFNYINMGVFLDLHCISKVLKKPVGPAIGFFCQFLFMPLASYGISLLLLDDISLRLGLFVLGCSPGGSMSNFWTLLFNGDVNLSVTMTFISTIAALAMMPLWIFTLGSTLFRDREAAIPYINLAGSLILLTLPIGIGLLIQQYSPRLTKFSRKIIKPFTFVCVAVGVVAGLYANSYVFSLFTWQVVLSGLAIAWGGYLFGGLMAWIFRLDRSQIVAVSIETAFQNPQVPFVMLMMSMPQPEADLSSVPVIAQLLLTGLPMWTLLVVIWLHKKIRTCCQEWKAEEQIEKPEIDTVQKAYLALETNPSPDDFDTISLEPATAKVNIVRFFY